MSTESKAFPAIPMAPDAVQGCLSRLFTETDGVLGLLGAIQGAQSYPKTVTHEDQLATGSMLGVSVEAPDQGQVTLHGGRFKVQRVEEDGALQDSEAVLTVSLSKAPDAQSTLEPLSILALTYAAAELKNPDQPAKGTFFAAGPLFDHVLVGPPPQRGARHRPFFRRRSGAN